MAEVKKAADGRIDGIRVPLDKAVKAGEAEIAKKLNRAIADKAAFTPQKVKQAVNRGLAPRLPLKPEPERTLNWRVVSRIVNNMLDPMKAGQAERVRFISELPAFWGSVCKLGTDEQKAWVRKRLRKFGKKFDVTLPDLDKDPKEFIDLINELTAERDAEHTEEEKPAPVAA